MVRGLIVLSAILISVALIVRLVERLLKRLSKQQPKKKKPKKKDGALSFLFAFAPVLLSDWSRGTATATTPGSPRCLCAPCALVSVGTLI